LKRNFGCSSGAYDTGFNGGELDFFNGLIIAGTTKDFPRSLRFPWSGLGLGSLSFSHSCVDFFIADKNAFLFSGSSFCTISASSSGVGSALLFRGIWFACWIFSGEAGESDSASALSVGATPNPAKEFDRNLWCMPINFGATGVSGVFSMDCKSDAFFSGIITDGVVELSGLGVFPFSEGDPESSVGVGLLPRLELDALDEIDELDWDSMLPFSATCPSCSAVKKKTIKSVL